MTLNHARHSSSAGQFLSLLTIALCTACDTKEPGKELNLAAAQSQARDASNLASGPVQFEISASSRLAAITMTPPWERQSAANSDERKHIPVEAFRLYDRGIAMLKVGDFEAATTNFDGAIKLAPRFDDAFFGRGFANSVQRRLQNAIDDFTSAINLDPSDYVSLRCRGRVFDTLGEMQKAKADYTQSLSLNPEDAQSYIARGVVHSKMGEWTMAVEDFSSAIKFDETNAVAFTYRGTANASKGDTNAAIADYSEAIRLDPKDTAAFFNRGMTYSNMREFDKAMLDFTKAIQLDTGDAALYYMRAGVHTEQGNWEKAIDDYRKAVDLDGLMHEALNSLAWLYATCPDAKFRDGKSAVLNAKKACELTAWSKWYCLGTLASAFAEEGDFERAVEYQKTALSLSDVPAEEREKLDARLSLYLKRTPYRTKVDSKRQPMQ